MKNRWTLSVVNEEGAFGALHQCGEVCSTVWTPSRPTSAFSWRCVAGTVVESLGEAAPFCEAVS
jgi:hypothetical protein